MSTQITNGTKCIRIVIDGVRRWTLPKRSIVLEVDGNDLRLRHPSGAYVETVDYTDVTAPAEASAEALRTAIKNFLIS